MKSSKSIHINENFLSKDELSFWMRYFTKPGFYKLAGEHLVFDQQAFPLIFQDVDDHDAFYKGERELVNRINQEVENTFGEKVLSDHSISFRKWEKGFRLVEHSDAFYQRYELDLQNKYPNRLPMAFNDFATILYYNDEYEGGEIRFPDCDLKIKPTPGMLIMFPCTHVHEVLEVTAGERFMSAHFWTRCKTVAMAIAQPDIDNWEWIYRNPQDALKMLEHTESRPPED